MLKNPLNVRFRRTLGALALICAGLGALPAAADVPLVDGSLWVRSSDDVKKAYLVGMANIVQVEAAYNADSTEAAKSGLSPRLVKGMQGQTLSSVLEALDRWYAANPGRLDRPVIETMWFEIVVPGLQAAK